MAVGTVSTRILIDIANAIRYQAGVSTLYKPREMAAAVAALDGTDPNNDQRTWFWAHFYEDGEAVFTATFAADMASFSYLNLNYLFYSCTNLASVSGLGNLSGVRSMRFTFASAVVAAMDFRGFDPSRLTDLYYTFSGCSRLATIYADST